MHATPNKCDHIVHHDAITCVACMSAIACGRMHKKKRSRPLASLVSPAVPPTPRPHDPSDRQSTTHELSILSHFFFFCGFFSMFFSFRVGVRLGFGR